MERQSHILRFRKERKSKDRSNPLGAIGFLLAALISIAASAGVIYAVSRYSVISRDLPSPEEMSGLLDPISGSLLEPTRILDRTGTQTLWLFEDPAIQARRYAAITDGETLFFSEVPEDLILATLAAVDPDYFQRPENFLAGLLEGGEDPVPEMIVKELLLWRELESPDYDIRARLLAAQLIASYGREKVLEWYLNSAYFGNQIYGVHQAAFYYFDKDLAELSLGESAMLAAVGSYPALNPLDAPVAAREIQVEVLDKMAAAGFISSSEAVRTARTRLIYPDREKAESPTRLAFTASILDEAGKTVPQERLLRGGFRILSTIDSELQGELTCSLEVLTERVYGQDPPLGEGCDSARLLPRYHGPYLDVQDPLAINLVIYDPLEGEILAAAGITGTGELPGLEKPRDPGSLITPYLYLNAFTQGFEPASLVWDIPLQDNSWIPPDLHPGGEAEFMGPVSMRTALVNDLLSPAYQLLEAQGQPQLRSTLGLFGYSLEQDAHLESSSDQAAPTLEMADLLQGFGVFVNRGYLKGRQIDQLGLEVQPAGVLRIEDLTGSDYYLENPLVEKKIISEELAYLLNHALSDQDAWLDPKTADVYRIGRPVGVKTGYVDGDRSGWVIGYTPRLVVGAWTGDLPDGSGVDPVDISSSAWRAITQSASQGDPVEGWEMPPGVITRDVCYPSGELPTEYCPRTVREVFIQGNEPLGLDGLYRAFEVNRETGLLASVFTPAGQIEERVYLNYPPLAESWAESTGIEKPPVLYDLGISDSAEDALSITAPENLSFVRANVQIRGSIPQEDFVSARLQYGAGLNPRAWLQIGADITSPGENKPLGTWDTTELEEGIYALQLVVIQESQQIQKESLLLSVDNTAPEIILVTDLSEGEIQYQRGDELLLEVMFSNPSEIDEVAFILDGKQLASRRVAPFLIPWQHVLGPHDLRIRAVDQAGNTAEINVDFRVIKE